MFRPFPFAFILSFAFFALHAAAQSTPERKVILGIINGKAIELPKPEYPAAAAAVARAAGEVKVQVSIDEKGDVISASPVSGHPLLRQAAEKAALRAKFTPTLLENRPVKVTATIVYNFVSDHPPEDDFPAWGVGMVFAFLQNVDPVLIKELGGEKELNGILTEMSASIPAGYEAEKALFEKLASAQDGERRKAAGELNQALKKSLSGSALWEVELGENIGALLAELLKQVKSRADVSVVDEDNLKARLLRIKTSLQTVPPGFSSEMTLQFKNVADFADAPDLKSAETLVKLLETILPLFGADPDEQ